MRSELFFGVVILLLVGIVLSGAPTAYTGFGDPQHCDSYFPKCYLVKKVNPNIGSPSQNIIPAMEGLRLCVGKTFFT